MGMGGRTGMGTKPGIGANRGRRASGEKYVRVKPGPQKRVYTNDGDNSYKGDSFNSESINTPKKREFVTKKKF